MIYNFHFYQFYRKPSLILQEIQGARGRLFWQKKNYWFCSFRRS